MGWLLFAPVLPLRRMRRLAFFVSYLVITALAYAAIYFTNNLAIALAIFVWPQFCIHARRLHDMGATAFWVVPVWFVEGLCAVLSAMGMMTAFVVAGGIPTASARQTVASMSGFGIGAAIVGVTAAVGFFLLLSLWPSSRKAKYGAPIGGAREVAESFA